MYLKTNGTTLIASYECSQCYKPLERMGLLCPRCLNRFKHTGGASRQMRAADIFGECINYQQALSKRIFGYNASIKYRVPKEQRLGYSLDSEEIAASVKAIDTKLTLGCKGAPSLFVTYRDVRSDKVAKRIFYYGLLWAIAYYIEGTRFETEDQFKFGMCHHIINYIAKQRKKQVGCMCEMRPNKIGRYDLAAYRYLFEAIHSACSVHVVRLSAEKCG